MGSDLNNIIKQQSLTDEHVQFLVYQILRGLKVGLVALVIKHVFVCIVDVLYVDFSCSMYILQE